MRRIVKVFLYALMVFLSGCAKMPLLASILDSSPKNLPDNADFQDDFSDPKSGWEQFQMDEGAAGYDKDTYQISVNAPNTDLYATFARSFSNSVVRVRIIRTEGTDNNNFGVICRYQDQENFYAGQISSDGFAGIFKIIEGDYQLLGRESMVPVPAILGGSGENVVVFECIDDTLALTVNGELADSQSDGAFKSGEVGLIAGTIDGSQGIFQFDDFSVSAE